MKPMINRSHIEGLIYQHDLKKKVTGDNSSSPGTQYITGTLDIATDNALTNIVSVHFTYVTAKTKQDKDNPSYIALSNIVDGVFGSVMANGAENATRIRIDSAIGLNDFYSDKSGTEELISVKRNEGGFVHTSGPWSDKDEARDTFECDMIITGVVHKDADDDRGLPEKTVIRGAIFDFRNSLLPVEFSATNKQAMDYFEGLDVSAKNPVFTKVKGRQVSEVITKTITEEGAFGEPSVREVKSSRKDYVITWALQDPYIFDDADTITAAELKKAMADRETYLATIKQRNDEYKANKNNGGNRDKGQTFTPVVDNGGFEF